MRKIAESAFALAFTMCSMFSNRLQPTRESWSGQKGVNIKSFEEMWKEIYEIQASV